MPALGYRKNVCKRGHENAGRTKSNNCVECERERSAVRESNPNAAANSSRWRKENPEKSREHYKNWRRKFPEKKNALDSLRRATLALRTPAWADLGKIRDVFRVAKQMQRDSGVRMSVDHVIPLKGEVVSGLHVHENLRIIPFVENCQKSNSYKCA